MPVQRRIKQAISENETAAEAYQSWVDENDNERYTQTLVPLMTRELGSGLHGPTIHDVHAALSDLRERGWTPST